MTAGILSFGRTVVTPPAFVINYTFDADPATYPSAFVTAVANAVSWFESFFSNPVTLNITIGYGTINGAALGVGALGESEGTSYVGPTYSSVVSALTAQSAPGASTLPGTSPLAGQVYVPGAQARALGLATARDSSLDGYTGFSNSVTWDYTQGETPPGGSYDFFDVFRHEITEVMGRTSLINYAPSFYSVMDLYRYTASGVRCTASGGSGSTAYFSIDNGVTDLGTWNNNASNGDLGDWYGSPYPSSGAHDAFNDFDSAGVVNAFSTTDITLLQAIGWTLA